VEKWLEPEPVCDLRDGELRRIEQLFGTQEPDLREILRRRGSGILPEHLAEPRIADRQAFGDPLRREAALDLAFDEGARLVDLADGHRVVEQKVPVLVVDRTQQELHDPGRDLLVTGLFPERIADELLVHADDRLAESQPEKRVARRKEPVGDLRIDAAAPESHPMFEPPGSPVGLVGMPLPGEEQDHRPGPDPLAAARTGLEIALPARYVDQLVLLQDAPLAGVENMGFGMLRLRVGTVRRDRLVPGRRDDQPPRLVVAADVEILYVAAR
jgi:hypothetical protein